MGNAGRPPPDPTSAYRAQLTESPIGARTLAGLLGIRPPKDPELTADLVEERLRDPEAVRRLVEESSAGATSLMEVLARIGGVSLASKLIARLDRTYGKETDWSAALEALLRRSLLLVRLCDPGMVVEMPDAFRAAFAPGPSPGKPDLEGVAGAAAGEAPADGAAGPQAGFPWPLLAASLLNHMRDRPLKITTRSIIYRRDLDQMRRLLAPVGVPGDPEILTDIVCMLLDLGLAWAEADRKGRTEVRVHLPSSRAWLSLDPRSQMIHGLWRCFTRENVAAGFLAVLVYLEDRDGNVPTAVDTILGALTRFPAYDLIPRVRDFDGFVARHLEYLRTLGMVEALPAATDGPLYRLAPGTRDCLREVLSTGRADRARPKARGRRRKDEPPPRDPSHPEAPPRGKWIVEPTMDVLVPVDSDPRAVLELGGFASLVQLDWVSRYRITVERTLSAMEEGATADDILRVLGENSAFEVPQAVSHTIRSWGKRTGAVRLYDGLVVACRGEEEERIIRNALGKEEPCRIQDGILMVSRESLHAIEAGIRKAGLPVPTVIGGPRARMQTTQPIHGPDRIMRDVHATLSRALDRIRNPVRTCQAVFDLAETLIGRLTRQWGSPPVSDAAREKVVGAIIRGDRLRLWDVLADDDALDYGDDAAESEDDDEDDFEDDFEDWEAAFPGSAEGLLDDEHDADIRDADWVHTDTDRAASLITSAIQSQNDLVIEYIDPRSKRVKTSRICPESLVRRGSVECMEAYLYDEMGYRVLPLSAILRVRTPIDPG